MKQDFKKLARIQQEIVIFKEIKKEILNYHHGWLGVFLDVFVTFSLLFTLMNIGSFLWKII